MRNWLLAFLMTLALSAVALGVFYAIGVWNIGALIGVVLVLPQMTYIAHDMIVSSQKARERAQRQSDAGGKTR